MYVCAYVYVYIHINRKCIQHKSKSGGEQNGPMN
jgi:hypothetical protein